MLHNFGPIQEWHQSSYRTLREHGHRHFLEGQTSPLNKTLNKSKICSRVRALSKNVQERIQTVVND